MTIVTNDSVILRTRGLEYHMDFKDRTTDKGTDLYKVC